MYCPRCGVLNLEAAKFCRACGADIGLVPQALGGRPAGAGRGAPEGVEGPRPPDPPTLEAGLESIFAGVALLIIFLLGLFYFTAGFVFWVWLVIPGLACVGKGVGKIIRWRALAGAAEGAAGSANAAAGPAGPRLDASPPLAALAAADTSEIVRPPATVTEETTRRLAARARTE